MIDREREESVDSNNAVAAVNVGLVAHFVSVVGLFVNKSNANNVHGRGDAVHAIVQRAGGAKGREGKSALRTSGSVFSGRSLLAES